MERITRAAQVTTSPVDVPVDVLRQLLNVDLSMTASLAVVDHPGNTASFIFHHDVNLVTHFSRDLITCDDVAIKKRMPESVR